MEMEIIAGSKFYTTVLKPQYSLNVYNNLGLKKPYKQGITNNRITFPYETPIWFS